MKAILTYPNPTHDHRLVVLYIRAARFGADGRYLVHDNRPDEEVRLEAEKFGRPDISLLSDAEFRRACDQLGLDPIDELRLGPLAGLG